MPSDGELKEAMGTWLGQLAPWDVFSTWTFSRPTREGGAMFWARHVIIAAANRDPAQFNDPEKFDITRDSKDNVAFGEGIHFCIGAPLARMEGAIAIGTALERFPHLKLKNPDAPVTYKGSYFLRGLSRLEMALE